MIDRAYPNGIDCVWLASDTNGNLGAFVTGGVGPIPLQALNYESIGVEELEEYLHELPQISAARLLITVPRPDDFVAMAERGFFVYDWRDVHRIAKEFTHTYEQVAVPLSPIFLDNLPESISGLISEIEFRNVRFADAKRIDVRIHMDCREGQCS
jgi:hypothetical protein